MPVLHIIKLELNGMSLTASDSILTFFGAGTYPAVALFTGTFSSVAIFSTNVFL